MRGIRLLRDCNKAVARAALCTARFLTETGSTYSQIVFWRIGGAIALFGAAMVIVSEVFSFMSMLTSKLPPWRSMPALCIRITLLFITMHLAIALWRSISAPISAKYKTKDK